MDALETRIKKLHAELNAAINAYVDERASQAPGVPRGSVEASILSRAPSGCRCEEYRIVNAKIEAERQLAERQEADAKV
jgi:hypothetical protein